MRPDTLTKWDTLHMAVRNHLMHGQPGIFDLGAGWTLVLGVNGAMSLTHDEATK